MIMATKPSPPSSSSTSSRSRRPRSAEREQLAARYLAASCNLAKCIAASLAPDPTPIDCEAIGQEALLAALERYDKRCSFPTLLYLITKRRIVDAIRKAAGRGRQARPTMRSLEEMRERAGHWADPVAVQEGDTGAVERCRRLFRCGLTPQQHELLCVLCLCDGDRQAAGEVLGIAGTRVSQLISQIRQRAVEGGV